MNSKSRNKSNSNDMTSGTPWKIILSFSVPVLLGLFFQQIYTAADTAIVSKTLGASALAAVGCLNSVNFLIIGFCQGLGSGLSIPIAQVFGAKDYNKLKTYMGNIVWIYLFFSVFVTLISSLLCTTILRITNTPDDIFSMAHTYMLVIFLGIPAQFAYNILSGVLRSLGDSKRPLYILIFSSVLNIALDLIFIICFHWGVFGAAFATILSQAGSAVGCLIIMIKKYPELTISIKDLKIDRVCFINLLKNGVPMGFMVSICGIGSLLLQASVNTLGSTAIAAITAAERIGQILQSATASLATTLSVYCGQNIGAGRIDRIKKGVRFGTIAGLIYAAAAFLAVYFFGHALIAVFIDGTQTDLMNLAYKYLLTVMMGFWGEVFIHVFRFALQGMGYPSVAMVSSTLEMIARAFIGLYLIPAVGFTGACFSNPLAWVLADLFILPMYFIVMRKLGRKYQKAEG